MSKAIFGGLLHGVGQGMVSQAEQRRQEGLERAREFRKQIERQEDRDFQVGRDEAQRTFQTERDLAQNKQPNSVQEFEYAQKNPEFKEFLKNTGSANSPASVQEWRFYSGLQPQDQKRFLELKRNPNMVVKDVGSVPTVIAPSVSGTEVTPLSTLPEEADAKAKIAGAEAGAKVTATTDAEKPAKNLELSKTLAVYEQARQGLLSGLEGTETGPLVGRIPAVTSGQQIAEGAVAAMAPVLKQLFRAAGEGVFTDRDQQLLLDMLPKRTDKPEARKAKMQNIDNIVRAKLGTSSASQGAPVKVSTPEEAMKLPSGTRFVTPDGREKVRP